MKSNVIREYKCKEGECKLLAQAKYIGMTTTTLSRRLTMHLQSGAIKKHLSDVHKRKLTRQDLVENTTITKHVTNLNHLRASPRSLENSQATVNTKPTDYWLCENFVTIW